MKARLSLITMTALGVGVILSPHLGWLEFPNEGSDYYLSWKSSLTLFAFPATLAILSFSRSRLIWISSLVWGVWMLGISLLCLAQAPKTGDYEWGTIVLSALTAALTLLFSYMEAVRKRTKQ